MRTIGDNCYNINMSFNEWITNNNTPTSKTTTRTLRYRGSLLPQAECQETPYSAAAVASISELLSSALDWWTRWTWVEERRRRRQRSYGGVLLAGHRNNAPGEALAWPKVCLNKEGFPNSSNEHFGTHNGEPGL